MSMTILTDVREKVALSVLPYRWMHSNDEGGWTVRPQRAWGTSQPWFRAVLVCAVARPQPGLYQPELHLEFEKLVQ